MGFLGFLIIQPPGPLPSSPLATPRQRQYKACRLALHHAFIVPSLRLGALISDIGVLELYFHWLVNERPSRALCKLVEVEEAEETKGYEPVVQFNIFHAPPPPYFSNSTANRQRSQSNYIRKIYYTGWKFVAGYCRYVVSHDERRPSTSDTGACELDGNWINLFGEYGSIWAGLKGSENPSGQEAGLSIVKHRFNAAIDNIMVAQNTRANTKCYCCIVMCPTNKRAPRQYRPEGDVKSFGDFFKGNVKTRSQSEVALCGARESGKSGHTWKAATFKIRSKRGGVGCVPIGVNKETS
ncbi:hypothetical protein FIBSPDRAFT_904696 [Athelia psychrophila]|uniref:Uncharacterized protein n=1 Tax=Athelia psychrophila TaxID=1759441 RepID=A0A167UEY8_9AGAM|nr:hypothetical protein FIBSPDRAFT_904696 [Fibularhizoctonia sp. CBS 109695]